MIAVATVAPAHVDVSPRLDGRLDEDAWQAATAFTDFVQKNPDAGGRPSAPIVAEKRPFFLEGTELIPLPIRPAVAFDLGADAAVVVQLAPRWAVLVQAVLGEVTLVGQTDRGVAPWHHLASVLRMVYATPYAVDVAFELHGDARDPRNAAGFALAITRRM